MKKGKEIEIKVKVEDIKSFLNFLEDKAKFISSKKQEDKYFTPAHKDFTSASPVREWLRLRSEEEDSHINYKNWHYNDFGEGLYYDEYEIGIEDDDMEKTEKMFKALGFKSIAKVKKERKTWKYKDYEIAVDKVEDLGDFIEIEYNSKEDEDHEQIVKEMLDFVRDFEVGEIRRVHMGYPFLLLFPQDVMYEKIK